MRRDHRPLHLKHLWGHVERGWTNHVLRPQFDAMGPDFNFMQPWYIRIYGPHISLGNHVHAIGARDRMIQFCSWVHAEGAGEIQVADHCLICPGVRIDSATRIRIGVGTMLASSAYVTDADWHDLYDRSQAIGTTRPVELHENVWIGDRATVCKGVTIGANTVVGTGAVVTHDLPANVIAGGNPAEVIRELDPEREIRGRAALVEDPEAMRAWLDSLDRMLHAGNTTVGWLRALVRPRRGD